MSLTSQEREAVREARREEQRRRDEKAKAHAAKHPVTEEERKHLNKLMGEVL